MSTATKALGLGPALDELRKNAEEFGLADIVENIEEQVDAFVETGKEWASKTETIWQTTKRGARAWTPIQTGNLAESVATDVQLPYIRVGVLEDKAPYSEAKNVGTKTGYGPNFIEAVWFEYATVFGNNLFGKGFRVL